MIHTNFVIGILNISYLDIEYSYIDGLGKFQYGNASLQLNAVLNGEYWVQNVALFQKIGNNKYYVTMIVNFWNLTGKFQNLKLNDTIITYNGLGVIIHEGPTMKVEVPFSLSLYLLSNDTHTIFGYILNGHNKEYYSIPVGGKFIIGGFSKGIGIPNSLEFVWGGPGGGSSVNMTANGTMELYYLTGNTLRIPSVAYNIGFDTAEGAVNIMTIRGIKDIFKPYAVLIKGVTNPNLLWPSNPTLFIYRNGSVIYVKLTLNSTPIPNQLIIIKNILFQNVTQEYTNSYGIAKFENIDLNSFIVYYPGNFTLSDTYAFSSKALEAIVKGLNTLYDKLLNFIKNFNYTKKIISIFNKNFNYTTITSTIAGSSQTNSLLTVLIISVGAFMIGVIISVITSRKP
jgi:thermopsin